RERVGDDHVVALAARVEVDVALDEPLDVVHVLHVARARTRQRERLDVDVLRPARGAEIEARRARGARLRGDELVDQGRVGLDQVGPRAEAVGPVGRVDVDDLELRLRLGERGVRGVVDGGLAAAPAGRQPGRGDARVQVEQLGARDLAGEVDAGELALRV